MTMKQAKFRTLLCVSLVVLLSYGTAIHAGQSIDKLEAQAIQQKEQADEAARKAANARAEAKRKVEEEAARVAELQGKCEKKGGDWKRGNCVMPPPPESEVTESKSKAAIASPVTTAIPAKSAATSTSSGQRHVNNDSFEATLSKKITPPLSTKADFLPNTGFPHGIGITHESGKCTENDPRCASGLPFPSFNNYTDRKLFGNGRLFDTRSFFTVRNSTNNTDYLNQVPAKNGDRVLLVAIIENNGFTNNPSTLAKNVTIKIDSLFSIGDGQYVTSFGQEIPITFTISSSNSSPQKISDKLAILSSTSNPIRLRFVSGENQLTIQEDELKEHKNISASNLFGLGENIGNINGADKGVWFYGYFYVEEASNITN